jgi:hypothetical protein
MLTTNLAVKDFIKISLSTKIQIQKICVHLRPNSGFGILGLGLKKQTKIGCVGWLSALSVLCVRIICWVGSGFKQQKTLCLRGPRVRKMVVWDGV